MNQEELKKYYSKAAALCSKSEKCSSDIFQKLINWGASEEMANEALSLLIKEKFVDDLRYAQFYVRDKYRFNKWGRIKISYMLKHKGISSSIIQTAMDEINEDSYYEILKTLIEEKSKKVKANNHFEKKAKLMRYAQSRGFEANLISEIINLKEE